VSVLQRFERRIEGLVQGVFAKVFKGEVHPSEIAQALQRELDDRRAVVAEGRVLVPNEFVVELGARDHERLAPFAEPLGRELAAMVREHADEQRYTFLGPVHVILERSADLDTGILRVHGTVAAGAQPRPAVDAWPGAAPAEHAPAAPAPEPEPEPAQPWEGLPDHGRAPGTARETSADPPQSSDDPAGASPAAPSAAQLVLVGSGMAFPLVRRVTLLGRGPDCDVRLADPGVSRAHAELRADERGHVLNDLGSTNGTSVNGQRLNEPRVLDDGDRLEIGSSALIYRRSG